MNDSGSGSHVHALAWAVVTLVLTLVAEDSLSGVAIATAGGSVVFGAAALTTKRASIRVYFVAGLALVVAVVGGLIAVSKIMAPQFF